MQKWIKFSNLIFQPHFEDPVILHGDFEGDGHFGTSLGKIGDLNGDGFNDLAVSAPMEGEGAVYIFLGSEKGISTKPIQKISLQDSIHSKFTGEKSLFGFSISGGADIDSNRYNDIAISAPNSEKVFIYKTYPVISIESQINSPINPLPFDNGTIDVRLCSKYVNNRNFSKEVCKLIFIFHPLLFNRFSQQEYICILLVKVLCFFSILI